MTEKTETETEQKPKLNQDRFVPGQLLSAQDIAKLEKARRERERSAKRAKTGAKAQPKTGAKAE